jgi:FkbM family methyltransferase
MLNLTKKFNNNSCMGSAITSRNNWLSNLNWQADFYQNSNKKRRIDSEFEWGWLERSEKKFCLRSIAKFLLAGVFRRMHKQIPWDYQSWLNNNANLLWEARELLEDDLSKLLFDDMLILRCCNYKQFYYPRINFEDFVSVINKKPFLSTELPLDYIGLPLRVFDLELHHQDKISPITVVSTEGQINLLNSYRQYFIKRNSVDLAPVMGDIVLDCGACIGEVSILIAGLVGAHGEVHSFDPVPLHARYCQLQASLNPTLSNVLHINILAISNISREVTGSLNDSDLISPGSLPIDSYSMTSLDDYVFNKKLSCVNFIKMDIEGAEMDALEGASRIIREFKPRLAISTYHKNEDLWEIPHKVKAQNSDYKLFFGHHSPIQWESVYYAA